MRIPSRFSEASVAIVVSMLLSSWSHAQTVNVSLKNGMIIGPVTGQLIDSIKVKGNANPNAIGVGKIAEMDDGLRKVFVDNSLIQGENRANVPSKIAFPKNQKLVASGDSALSIPAFTESATSIKFDILGRRLYLFNTGDFAIQGITNITPQYIQLEGLTGAEGKYAWDMRISINSIPAAGLREIFLRNADINRVQSYWEVLSFYRAAGRYVEAREFASLMLQLFPEEDELPSVIKELEQLTADQLLGFAKKLKTTAGQHRFAKQILDSFEVGALSLETQLQVKMQRDKEDKEIAEQLQWIAAIKEDVSKLTDPTAQNDCQPIVAEIETYLTADTLVRLTDYIRLRDSVKADQRVALAIGGWLFGAGLAEENLSLVLSAIRTRKLIQQYLSGPSANDALLDELSKQESGTPRYVSRIVANMAPPMSTSDQSLLPVRYLPDPTQPEVVAQKTIPGRYILEVPLPREMAGLKATYVVQLPPEYNPFRTYPCVVTMHGQSSNPEDQLNWWCGSPDLDAERGWGEASKNGYIVISPFWAMPKQPTYNYTENEHCYVLSSLMDAKRRFSIDNDRVFLSGHHTGGNGAWDIALAHPDLWAGAVIICGIAEKYVIQYLPNAKYVPQYCVTGEFAAMSTSRGNLSHRELNTTVWDKFLQSRQYDFMLTIYNGRGFDHFQEELPRIFEWMNLPNHVRNFAPESFSVKTERMGDRFFWWFETDQLKDGKNIKHPLLYEAGTEHVVESEIKKLPNNVVFLKTVPAERYTINLTPDMVDFGRTIEIKGPKGNKRFEPNPETRVILKDVRTRCDRQHPFWMSIPFPN